MLFTKKINSKIPLNKRLIYRGSVFVLLGNRECSREVSVQDFQRVCDQEHEGQCLCYLEHQTAKRIY